jgi:hypothetical protein
MTARRLLIAVLMVLSVFGAGWMTGASGRAALELARNQLERRGQMLEARAALFEGRVAVAHANFGLARESFGRAGTTVGRLQASMRETGEAERAGRLEIAVAHLRDAARLAGEVNANADAAAAEALRALDAAMPAE